jgi:hypothetical protein
VISVQIPTLFPSGEMPMLSNSSAQHWYICHREDAAKVLLLIQKAESEIERYLETAYRKTSLARKVRLGCRDTGFEDSNVRRLVRNDFELFFEREDWFRQHNLPN